MTKFEETIINNISDEKTVNILQYINANLNQEVVIRNKHDTIKLSNQTQQLLKEERKQRLYEAIQDNDILYLNNFFNNISILDIIRILVIKLIKH